MDQVRQVKMVLAGKPTIERAGVHLKRNFRFCGSASLPSMVAPENRSIADRSSAGVTP